MRRNETWNFLRTAAVSVLVVTAGVWTATAWHSTAPVPSLTDTDEDLPTIDDDDDDDEDDYRGSFDEDEDADEDVCSVLPRDKSKADSKNELECKEPKEGKRQPAAGPAEDTLPSGYTRWLGPPGGSMELSEEGAPPAQAAQPVYAVLDRISKDRVAFFNFGTGALVASIDLAQGLAFQLTAPQRMATSLDGRTIAVTNFADGFGGVTNPPHVTVIDAERRSILGRVLLPADEFVEAIEIAPDMRTAYVGAWERIATPPFAANPRILVVDLQTRTVTARIPLPVELAGYEVERMQLTPDGALLFVVGESIVAQGVRIHVVDTATRTIAATVRAEQTGTFFTTPLSLAMDPDGSTVWAALVRRIVNGTAVWGVGGLDTTTLQWREFVNLQRPRNAGASDVLHATPDGDALYFSERNERRMSRISIPKRRLEWESATDERHRGEFFFVYR